MAVVQDVVHRMLSSKLAKIWCVSEWNSQICQRLLLIRTAEIALFDS